MQNAALLIIDVQNDFCPGGALAVEGGDQIVPVINAIAPKFGSRVLTQDWHPSDHMSFASNHKNKSPFELASMPYGDQLLWPDHCVQGTQGSEFHSGLSTLNGDLIIRKGFRPSIDSYSAFFENDQKTPTGLKGYLDERGFKKVFLAGLATDYCVAYSALDALSCGYECSLILDACRAIDLDGSLAKAMNEMTAAGVKFLNSKDL